MVEILLNGQNFWFTGGYKEYQNKHAHNWMWFFGPPKTGIHHLRVKQFIISWSNQLRQESSGKENKSQQTSRYGPILGSSHCDNVCAHVPFGGHSTDEKKCDEIKFWLCKVFLYKHKNKNNSTMYDIALLLSVLKWPCSHPIIFGWIVLIFVSITENYTQRLVLFTF